MYTSRALVQNISLFKSIFKQNSLNFATKSVGGGTLNVGVLGVPFNKGQGKQGVDRGPEVIRKSGLINEISAIGVVNDVKDYGDVAYEVGVPDAKPPRYLKNTEHVGPLNGVLAETVRNIINDERFCVTLGGDHSIAVGSISGHVAAKGDSQVGIIWVDAHADINTALTSGTGNMHGMPVSLLCKELEEYWPDIPNFEWKTPSISVRDIAYIALRDVDTYERLILDKFGIAVFDMQDVQQSGITAVMEMALKKVDPLSTKSLHVSFDIDAIDSVLCPSTGTPVIAGLTLREGLHIMEAARKTGRLTAIDLVEVNPAIGDENDVERTVRSAKLLILAACGHKRGGEVCSLTEIPRDESSVLK